MASSSQLSRSAVGKRSRASIASSLSKSSQRKAVLKGLDTDCQVSTILDTTNDNQQIQPLNLIAAGSGSFNRVGRKVFLHSVRVRGLITYTSYNNGGGSSVLSAHSARLVLVWDRQPSSGSAPAFSDIFGTTQQDGTETTLSIYDPLRYDNTGRFVVLHDHVQAMNPTVNTTPGSTDAAHYEYPVDLYISLKGLATLYSGDSSPATLSDISSGALYLVTRGTHYASGYSSAGFQQCYARLRYTD